VNLPTLEEISQLDPMEIPEILGELEKVKVALWGRLMNPPSQPERKAEPEANRLLSIPAVAQRLGCTKAFAYDLVRKKILPSVQLSLRNTRVKESDLNRCLTMKKKIDNPLSLTYSTNYERVRAKENSQTNGTDAGSDG